MFEWIQHYLDIPCLTWSSVKWIPWRLHPWLQVVESLAFYNSRSMTMWHLKGISCIIYSVLPNDISMSHTLFQRLDEYPLKSVKDLFTTPATEGEGKVREQIEVLPQCFGFHTYKGTWMKMTPQWYRNELGFTFNPLNCVFFKVKLFKGTLNAIANLAIRYYLTEFVHFQILSSKPYKWKTTM